MTAMKDTKQLIRHITRGALIAAMYAALTLLASFFGLAFGPIQVRVSEALTILPAFSASTIPALTIGCLLANLIGLISGSPLGWLDLIVGTAATLVSALLSLGSIFTDYAVIKIIAGSRYITAQAQLYEINKTIGGPIASAVVIVMFTTTLLIAVASYKLQNKSEGQSQK